MNEQVSARALLQKIIGYRKIFLIVNVATIVLTTIILLLMPKQYKSTAVLFAARQFSVSKLVIEANAGNQEDYMQIGDEDDCEKLIQLLQSDALKLKVANAFDLWTRWRIRDTVFSYHYLRLKWEDMVSIKRTEFNSVKVQVHDYTANGAAQIANGIVQYCDSVKADMSRELTGKVLRIVKAEYDSTLSRMKVLEDSMQSLRNLGVLHYKEQVRAYSRSYARALEKGDQQAARRLKGKLDTLTKFGGAYQIMKDNLERYGAKYPDIKAKYDEALVNHTSILPVKFVVEYARPNEYKSRPRYVLTLGIVLLANNFITLLFLLIRDRFRQLLNPAA
jgi:hypothetical protein